MINTQIQDMKVITLEFNAIYEKGNPSKSLKIILMLIVAPLT
jgi:hypothetical protein